MKIEFGPRFVKALKQLGEAERAEAEEALRRLQEVWGRPHRHAVPACASWAGGCTSSAWACDGRIAIADAGDHLVLEDILSHDGIRRWVKNR
jgi:hypothetical protein